MTAGSEKTMRQAPAWHAQAVALLTRQEELLQQLDQLSQRQSDLIAAGDTEMLLSVLTDRQPIVEQIAGTTEQLAKARVAWADLPDSDPWRAGISERMRRSSDLAAAIAMRDREDEAAMRRAGDAIAAELGSLGRQRNAAAAYATGTPSTGARLQDREG